MAGQQGQPKYGFGWPDGRLGGTGPPGSTTPAVTGFKFLGLIISSNLKWNKHLDHISIKVSKVIGIMFRIKYIVPCDVLQTLYNSLIMPHFHYCLLAWESTIKN